MLYKEYSYDLTQFGMTESEYKIMIDILEEHKPNRICELGSGQSTIIFEHYCDKYNSELYSIEHDESFKRHHSIILPLIENTSIQINNIIYDNCNKYDGLENMLKQIDKFDFVLIDGPFGFGFREQYTYSRVQLLSFILLDKLTDNAVVLYHDSERYNAKTTLNEFERLLNDKKFTFEKQVINDYPELTIYLLTK